MRVGIVCLTIALAGCATMTDDEPQMRGAGTCTDEGVDRYIGQQASSELGADILRTTTADRLRWINRDTLVTADYREDRINVDLDDTGRVTGMRCG